MHVETSPALNDMNGLQMFSKRLTKRTSDSSAS